MLTLEQFSSAIEQLIATEDKNAEFNKDMEKYSGTYFISELNEPAGNALVDVLEIIFKDTDNWISYWLYELKRGTSDLEASTADNTPIPLKTIEDLYNLLISNYTCECNCKG